MVFCIINYIKHRQFFFVKKFEQKKYYLSSTENSSLANNSGLVRANDVIPRVIQLPADVSAVRVIRVVRLATVPLGCLGVSLPSNEITVAPNPGSFLFLI